MAANFKLTMEENLPNFLFIGPDKAGSTWLFRALKKHKSVYLPYAKELFFFDRFYEKGWSWYFDFFKDAGTAHQIIGEICHDYLFSRPACERIARDIPSAKLMVCLREPSQRAFSSYLYMIKQGRVSTDFETALQQVDELIDHGYYAKHLEKYLQQFPREQIYVAIFDDLAVNPQQFFDDICKFLGIEQIPLPEDLKEKALTAAKPRSRILAGVARRIGWQVRSLGMPGVVNRIKLSPLLNRVLYDVYSHRDKPKMSPATLNHLRTVFYSEIQRLDSRLGLDLCNRWGYEKDL
jgi:hypothetical protein